VTYLQTVPQDQNAMAAPAATHIANLLVNDQIMTQLFKFAELMASGRATVPKHFQGNVGDCMAVVMQAAQWGMNPHAVAQKTHMTQGGQLGYEAQLVNAVVTSRAPVLGRFEFEFIGDWDRILGKVIEKTGNSGGKYYAPDWNKTDEAGLGVIVKNTLRGEMQPREVKIMLTQCYPRFSTQWATDPQQQITYVAVKKWARRYTPDVILGVYTPDELDDQTPTEREINPRPAANDGAMTSSLDSRLAESDDAAEAHPFAQRAGGRQQQPANPVEKSETVQQNQQNQQPDLMPNFDQAPVDAEPQRAPVDELLTHLPHCKTREDLEDWRGHAMAWPEGSPEYIQLIEAHNTHVSNLKHAAKQEG
jgi:hypothetical protein